MSKPQLRLSAFMRPASIHTGAWRYPGAFPDANFNFAHLKRFAQKLEHGKFDAFFMADHLAVLNMPMDALKRSHTVTSFEPFTLLSALAMVTERIGLAATGSTTFDEPYHVARRFASLDHLSGGRAGLEHRHHLQSRRRAEFRAGRSRGAWRALPARARILRRGHRPVGFAGRTTRSSAMSRPASISIPTSCTCSTTRDNICPCAAPSTSRGPCRAGR